MTRDNRIAGSRFLARLVDIVYYLFTVVAAITTLLTVLYLSGDWALLGLAVLFLVGLAWALKNTLPALLEQARLMLNPGPVREGERLVYRQRPKNLSIATFVVNQPLMLDYRLRDLALDEVPRELKRAAEQAVARQPYDSQDPRDTHLPGRCGIVRLLIERARPFARAAGTRHLDRARLSYAALPAADVFAVSR